MKKNIWIKQPWENFDYCWEAKMYKDIYTIVVYTGIFDQYEMRITIPEDKSITERQINITCFYDAGKDFNNFSKWEKDAKKLINNLIK